MSYSCLSVQFKHEAVQNLKYFFKEESLTLLGLANYNLRRMNRHKKFQFSENQNKFQILAHKHTFCGRSLVVSQKYIVSLREKLLISSPEITTGTVQGLWLFWRVSFTHGYI